MLVELADPHQATALAGAEFLAVAVQLAEDGAAVGAVGGVVGEGVGHGGDAVWRGGGGAAVGGGVFFVEVGGEEAGLGAVDVAALEVEDGCVFHDL